jgi:hypothetical protein
MRRRRKMGSYPDDGRPCSCNRCSAERFAERQAKRAKLYKKLFIGQQALTVISLLAWGAYKLWGN